MLTLSKLRKQVFRKSDLMTALGGGIAAERTIEKLTRGGVLVRAARGVYVCVINVHEQGYLLYDIARALRRGEWAYESFFSAASLHGLVSQCAESLTLATSGCSHTFVTEFSIIDFVHVPRAAETAVDPRAVIERTREGIPLATIEVTRRDCERSGKSMDLIREMDDE